MAENLITIKNCRIENGSDRVDWTMKKGEAWLIIGPNGGGKAAFVNSLSGNAEIIPNEVKNPSSDELPLYSSVFKDSTAIVSLEVAARLIEEERERDESEYMNKEDEGRTGRAFIAEVLGSSSKKGEKLPDIAYSLENMIEVKLCGVEKVLDRGLRYMSTGEIRRTLLCRALLSGKKLIILSDPFAGLDAESRKILLEFFDSIASRQLKITDEDSAFPRIIICMERFSEIPDCINRVLEFSNGKITYCGERSLYEKKLAEKKAEKEARRNEDRKAFVDELNKIRLESQALVQDLNVTQVPDSLIKFENVNVGWGEHRVLVNLNWEVKKNVHWLIRGPNGSGKTTILELITGDNMQVFRENIFLFGKKRGSGETIWDIKKQLGIVSYRLHVEYRMVGGTELQDVIISGFKDSIGLYESASDYEKATARAWLKLAGFEGREHALFSELSYGEQRAVLILRAAVKNPRVLILDEPCHGLDENYRQKILDLLETVAETGTTTLLHVTHDPDEVLDCEKHILELKPGKDPMYEILEKGN